MVHFSETISSYNFAYIAIAKSKPLAENIDKNICITTEFSLFTSMKLPFV